MDKRKKLIQEIQEFEKKAEKNKAKRSAYTILFYTVVYALIIYQFVADWTDGIISKFLVVVLISIVFSVISFFINATIFSQLIDKGRAESEMLKAMEKRLREFDEEHNVESRHM